MADTPLTLNPGALGADLAMDADGDSELHQYVKVEFGASGTQTPVTTAAPLPVDLRGSNVTQTVDNVGTFVVQVDGDALTALQLLDDAVYADNIHSAVLEPAIRVDTVLDCK